MTAAPPAPLTYTFSIPHVHKSTSQHDCLSRAQIKRKRKKGVEVGRVYRWTETDTPHGPCT